MQEATKTPSVDTTQQVTAPQPNPAPREKNPKRVAAGKLVAERTRIAREKQKKALAEAEVYFANEKNRKTAPQERSNAVNPVADDTGDKDSALNRVYNNGLTTNQWLSVIGIGVSLLGIYYFRESLKRKAGEQFYPDTPVRKNASENLIANAPANVRRIRNLD